MTEKENIQHTLINLNCKYCIDTIKDIYDLIIKEEEKDFSLRYNGYFKLIENKENHLEFNKVKAEKDIKEHLKFILSEKEKELQEIKDLIK